MSDKQDFVVALKSTLDREGKQIADTLGVEHFVDLDDSVNATEALTGPDDVVMWRLLTYDDSPVDPLYQVGFVMGIKTSADPSNYRLLTFMGEVKDRFEVGDSMFVKDWTGTAEPTVDLGRLFFVTSGIDTQALEADSGFRLLPVTAMVQRFT